MFPVLVNLLGNKDGISDVVGATVGVNKCPSAVRPLCKNSYLSGGMKMSVKNRQPKVFYDTLTRLYLTVTENFSEVKHSAYYTKRY